MLIVLIILFVSIGLEPARNIVSTVDQMSYVNSSNNSIVISSITIAEVKQTILSFNNSSPRWDHFPVIEVKQSIDSYTEPLTWLINRSFANEIVPIELKLARVVLYLNLETIQVSVIQTYFYSKAIC